MSRYDGDHTPVTSLMSRGGRQTTNRAERAQVSWVTPPRDDQSLWAEFPAFHEHKCGQLLSEYCELVPLNHIRLVLKAVR